MGFKGTPAPWFCMNGTDIFTGLNSINANGIKSDKTDGWQIADCSVGKTCVDGEYIELSVNEQIANAHLISSAPELLEALIEIVEMQSKNYGNGMVTHMQLANLAKKAKIVIEKALGQQ
ncbi:MAG: hypothetical protein [Phage NV18]|nr:MAG: hypothetical protein [Phage NV18]